MSFLSVAKPTSCQANKLPNRPAVQPPSIMLTIDVEDWFQVENFKEYIPTRSWPSFELRVEKNTHKLLDLFDSFRISSSIQHPASSIHVTFFILGWIAERLPQLVQEIHTRGHEVASHGYNHELCNRSLSENLKEDLNRSKMLLEDIIGDRVFGYRAPSFSINNEILALIRNCGYHYDSSYNSFGMHDRYGRVDLSQYDKVGIAKRISQFANRKSKILYELPISNMVWGNHVIPWGGGGYFRLIPFPIFRLGIQSILKKEESYLFYCHPWEFDDGQPRVNEAAFFYKFRHYSNLAKMQSKLIRLIESFKDCAFVSCKQYLESYT